MKTKLMPVAKKDVEELTGDELALLRGFAKSEEYKVLMKIAEKAKTRRAFEALESTEIKQISVLSGMNIGVDFIMDTVNRAKEELSTRGDEQESEEDIDSKE